MSPVGFKHVHSTVPLLEKKIQQWGLNLCLLEEKKEKKNPVGFERTLGTRYVLILNIVHVIQ